MLNILVCTRVLKLNLKGKNLTGPILLGSFYSILVRKLSDDFSPVELTYVMFIVGFIFFMAMAFIQHRADTVPMIISALSDIKFIASVLYLGAAASIGAYMLANYALSRLPVTRATIFNSFSTIVSVSSGVILMHDPFTLTSAIAFTMILFGVFGVNRFAASDAAESAIK